MHRKQKMAVNANRNEKVNTLRSGNNVEFESERQHEDISGVDEVELELSREMDKLFDDYFDEATNQLQRQIEQELDDALQMELDNQIENQISEAFQDYHKEHIENDDKIHLEMERILNFHEKPQNQGNERVTVADIDATIKRVLKQNKRC